MRLIKEIYIFLHEGIDTLKGEAVSITDVWFKESQMIYLTGGHSYFKKKR